jgi:gliding motility associated protien GldN
MKMQMNKLGWLSLMCCCCVMSMTVFAAPKKTKKPSTPRSTTTYTSSDGADSTVSSSSTGSMDQSGTDQPGADQPGADQSGSDASTDASAGVVDSVTSTPFSPPASSSLSPAAATAATVGALDTNGARMLDTTPVPKLPWMQEITGKRKALGYEPIREADVFWWKTVWRVIDLREKLNLHFKWPKAPFIQILLDAVQTGKCQVYSGMDDDFSAPIQPQEALNVAGGGVDSIYVTDPGTGIQTLQVVTKEVNWNNVNKLRLKEVWYFNKQTSTMEVRIMGICPLYDNYDPTTGDFRGEVPVFWVYFPSLRQTLVNSEAYNPFPNGVRLNWDQVYALRLFGSYIYKIDNVQDFRIKDYKSGIDILYESEAKKQELFNFEHDLWEY